MKNTELVFNKIKELCKDQNFTLETNKFLADETGVSVKTISRVVKQLKSDGTITTKRVDNRRRITLVGVDSGEDQNTKEKCLDNDEKGQDIPRMNIEEEFKKLEVIPEWKILTLLELLESECKEKGVESDISTVSMVRFVRVFNFKPVLKALENYMEISTGDILEKDFKRYLYEKYINIPNVKKIREAVKS